VDRKRKYCSAPVDRYTPTVNHKIYRAFYNLSDYFIGAQKQEMFLFSFHGPLISNVNNDDLIGIN
jgi:hypothetical protein